MTSDKNTPKNEPSPEEKAFDQRLTNAYQVYKKQTLADYKRKTSIDKLLRRKGGGTHWQPVWSVALMASFALVVFVLTLPQQELLRQEASFDRPVQKIQQPAPLEDVADMIRYEQDQTTAQASEAAKHKAEKLQGLTLAQPESAPAITIESVQTAQSLTDAATQSKAEADTRIKNQAIAAQRKVKESLKPASPAVEAEVQAQATEEPGYIFEEEAAERITVTGSRIKRTDIEKSVEESRASETPVAEHKVDALVPTTEGQQSPESKIFIGKIVLNDLKYTIVNCARTSIAVSKDWLSAHSLKPGEVIEILLEQDTPVLMRREVEWPCPSEAQE